MKKQIEQLIQNGTLVFLDNFLIVDDRYVELYSNRVDEVLAGQGNSLVLLWSDSKEVVSSRLSWGETFRETRALLLEADEHRIKEGTATEPDCDKKFSDFYSHLRDVSHEVHRWPRWKRGDVSFSAVRHLKYVDTKEMEGIEIVTIKSARKRQACDLEIYKYESGDYSLRLVDNGLEIARVANMKEMLAIIAKISRGEIVLDKTLPVSRQEVVKLLKKALLDYIPVKPRAVVYNQVLQNIFSLTTDFSENELTLAINDLLQADKIVHIDGWFSR